jgi:signal transduction histidine kinase
MRKLVGVVQQLSMVEDMQSIVEVVKRSARELTGADGATFVLKDRGFCHYVDEDAIGPLWKGKRFPLESCVSGWAMHHKVAAIIPDIYQDPRVPTDAYRPTFVKSMVMVPIRKENPIGAIGNYWANPHEPTEREIDLLQSLADSTSIAISNIQLLENLQRALEQEKMAHFEVDRQLSLRDEFISIASHELKTPLTPVLIHVQVLQKLLSASALAPPRPEKLLQSVTSIEKQFRRFAHLVENLLDVSRIRLGKLQIRFEEGVDLGEIVEKTVAQFQGISSSVIDTELEGSLTGNWDRMRIEQIVTNLVSNAIRYGEGRRILVGARNDGDSVELFCRDQGVGIPKEAQERIFQRFERASKIESYGGLGLGLFIVRQIVAQHGGTIWVESEPGKGSTFHVHLPISAAPSVAAKAG